MGSAAARGRGLFRRDWVDARLEDPHAETGLGGSQLWQAAILEMWLQEHGI
jgi:asparagine synthase (glutamine-hydrolysing)